MDNILSSPCFVIHLPKNKERLSVKTHIEKAGFKNVNFFEGVDGKDRQSIKRALEFLKNPAIDKGISTGGLGCLLSHLTLLKRIVDAKLPFATIFEDDVFFHPEWEKLCQHYYYLTPEDYEVIFIGNQLDSCLVSTKVDQEITKEPVYCTHAYVVTLNGARRMLECLLGWNYHDTAYTGLTLIDVMIKQLQFNTNYGLKKQIFQWYSWNGTKYPCLYNKLPVNNITCRNTGLVFQDIRFPSMVQKTEIARYEKDFSLRPTTRRIVRPMSFR